MGLDQFLHKKTYVKNWDYMKPEELHQVTVTKNGVPVSHIKPNRVSSIVEEVAYWRKANAIHHWFINNCQDGVDDCRSSYVSTEQLQELVNICKQIQADHTLADELLPSQGGFFFGGTEYDEWYFRSIDETIEMLDPVLNDESDGDFEYDSSW